MDDDCEEISERNELMAGETEILGGNLPQCRPVHHRPHMTWPRLEPGTPRWATNRLS
jgi:hypothetical protein